MPLAAPTLFIDAASPTIVVGLQVQEAGPVEWRASTEEAGMALFRTTEELLGRAAMSIGRAATIGFCDGPGSLLGIRLAAIAVRTWAALPRAKPLQVFAYHSLGLVAAAQLADGAVPPFRVCSDARRETWNVLAVAADGTIGDIRRCRAAELAQDESPLLHPESFPTWQPLPAGVRQVSYPARRIHELGATFRLWRESAAPDAFMVEQPAYRTWTPA